MIRNLVVVGIDDSAASRAAMEWAADYARMIDARLKAVHVRPAVTGPHETRTRPTPAATDRQAERVRDIFYSVNPEPGWTLTTARGASAADVLVRTAEHAVLLVVGSRQVSGMLHHSVSRHCTLHATVPVVVCPDLDKIEVRQRVARQAAATAS